MALFGLTFVFMLVVVGAMAVGAMLKDKPIKGTCGGLNDLGIDGDCMICGKKGAQGKEPKKITEEDQINRLFYEVSQK